MSELNDLKAELTAAAHARTTLQTERDRETELRRKAEHENVKLVAECERLHDRMPYLDEYDQMQRDLAASEQARTTLQQEIEKLKCESRSPDGDGPLLARNAEHDNAPDDDNGLPVERSIKFPPATGGRCGQPTPEAGSEPADSHQDTYPGYKREKALRIKAEGDRLTLRQALHRYGHHNYPCQGGVGQDCTCGFQDALKDDLARNEKTS